MVSVKGAENNNGNKGYISVFNVVRRFRKIRTYVTALSVGWRRWQQQRMMVMRTSRKSIVV